MAFEWILFDLDNTLFDFDASEKYALMHTFREFEIEYLPKHVALYHEANSYCWTAFEKGEMDVKVLRKKRFELLSDELKIEFDAGRAGDRYLQLLASTDFKIEGALDLLDDLKPRFNLAVVTNGLQEVKRPQLAKPEIAHYFEAIIISEEVGVAKPHAGFFEYTFDQILQPDKSEVMIIGDNLNSDIKGGNNFGIATCWFNPQKKVNNTDVKPTYEIDRLNHLLKILE